MANPSKYYKKFRSIFKILTQNTFNINTAIEEYSSAFGNNTDKLKDYLAKCNKIDQHEVVKQRIDAIQNEIMNSIIENDQAVSGKQLLEIISQYCAENEREIDEAGINGLLQYIAWYCWHEGYLKD